MRVPARALPQYVSEASHSLTLIGSDDGLSWFSATGFCDGPKMTRIHFDFSSKGGPADATATWTKDGGVVRLVWDDGNTWVLQAATSDSNLVPDATPPTAFEQAAGFWFPLVGIFTSNDCTKSVAINPSAFTIGAGA